MWKLGDRVLACRQPGIYYYPGTIRHINEDRYYVIFDDGEDGFASGADLLRLQFDAGDQVMVYNAAMNAYASAAVLAVEPDTLRIRYGNGEEQTVALTRIRVHPETWKQAAAVVELVEAVPWSVCDRVLACWFDLDWYPGIVLGMEEDRIHVLFDMGGQALVAQDRVRPLQMRNGERVLCRWKAGRDYYSGIITDLEGEKIAVRYDDGDEETTSVRLLRLRRDHWFPDNPGLSLVVGDHVLACWYDFFWYPGVVAGVEGKRIHIAFDDGDHALVTPDHVRPLEISVGAHVFCRRQGGPQYWAGEVTESKGERIHVVYDDGEEEWTTIRMIRLKG